VTAKPLTAAAVAKYRPGPERRRIRDAGARSLFLVIEASGHKSWQMRFRTPAGRIAKITLGPVDLSGRELVGDPQIGQPLSVAAARQLAAAVHRERALGRDVVADHRARRHRRRAEIEERGANTYAAAARKFIDEHARPKTRRWPETARLLGLRYPKGDGDPEEIPGSLVERWADKGVRDIDEHDVWSVIDEARRLGVPGIVPRTPGISDARPRALAAALSSMFGWLHLHRYVGHNPCANLHRPAGPKKRERVLSNDEIRWFWAATDAVGSPFTSIFQLLLLLGARLNEIARMTSSELHEVGVVWQLGGERTKNRRPHTVPLPPLARQIIASLPRQPGFLFGTNGRSAPSGWGRAKRRLDAAMVDAAREERGPEAAIPPWRLHDLRRTAVTGMAELGIAPHVVERVVNHVSGHQAGVAGVYNKSELMPERTEALERWARHVAGLVALQPDNKVVNLARKRGR
jgi:integrase